MRRALAEYTVLGIHTTLPFLDRVLRHAAFVAGDFDTAFVERVFADARRAAASRLGGRRWPRPPSRASRTGAPGASRRRIGWRRRLRLGARGLARASAGSRL